MSDITANIVVEPINLNIQAQQNEITITPEAIGLNVYLGGLAVLGGNVGELQFNNAGSLGGVTNTNFSAGNLSLGNVANVKIGGGVNTYYLQTDGTGNLSWGVGAGNVTGNGTPGGTVNQIQYNLDGANFGGSAGFTFDPSSNAFATPGAAGVGGNLTVLQSANIVGNIIANNFVGTYANGNTEIDIPSANGNVNISVGGNPNILVVTNTSVAITGDLSVTGGIAGTLTTAAQPNITSVGTLSNLSVTGNLSSGNANLGNAATANFFIGSGNNLSNIQGANVSGPVANATFATSAGTAGTVTTAAQPNITSVGTLSALTVTGNITLASTFVKPIQESVTIVGTAPGANYTYNLIDQAVVYNTANANANLTLNFVGNGTITANSFISNANSIVATYLMTNGGPTAYAISAVNVDGNARTIRWAGNTVPTTYLNTIMSYTFNLIKTASNTYTVMGSATRYG